MQRQIKNQEMMKKLNTAFAQKETLKTAEIARITGCSVNEVRYRMRHNIWTFGVVRKTGAVKKHYEATISRSG
jgi:hypothetical protein